MSPVCEYESARVTLIAGDAVDKSYYTYDFQYGSGRVLLTAAVDSGNVILLGTTAPVDRWTEVEGGFRRAAASFKVGNIEVVAAAKAAAAAAGAGGDGGAVTGAGGSSARRDGGGEVVDMSLPRTVNKPAEDLNCKGPLPIFCSVEPTE